jgi:hypothetical protein
LRFHNSERGGYFLIYHERKDGTVTTTMKGVKAPTEATRILERGKNGNTYLDDRGRNLLRVGSTRR